MDDVLRRLKVLEATVEQRKSAVDRAQAQLEVHMGRLLSEFGCSTVEDAEALYEKLTQEQAALRQEIQHDVDELSKLVMQ